MDSKEQRHKNAWPLDTGQPLKKQKQQRSIEGVEEQAIEMMAGRAQSKELAIEHN
jgi:hypothetical protein